MIVNSGNIGEASFFLFGILFILFANLQGHYLVKLRKSLGSNSPNFYDVYFLWGIGIPGFFIPHPITIVKYIWFTKRTNENTITIVRKIQLYQFLSLLCFFLMLFFPMILNFISVSF